MATKQKSVLITGCSAGGLGAAFAEEFHRNGWLVFASARNLTKVQHLKELGCEVVELDVTKEGSLQEAVKVVTVKADGKLDMLINNAGITFTATVLDADLATVKELFNINVFGVLSTTQHFSPLLLKAKGTIANIGSITSFIDGPYASLYAGSKATLSLMSHAMRQEMEPLGLHVVYIGLVQTNIFQNQPPRDIPETSHYFPIKAKAEALMNPTAAFMPANQAARRLYSKLTRAKPAAVVWEGNTYIPPRILACLAWMFGPRVWDLLLGGISGLNDLAKYVKLRESKKAE